MFMVVQLLVQLKARTQEFRRKKKEISPLPLCQASTITYLGLAE
jgi:hypothetical protein